MLFVLLFLLCFFIAIEGTLTTLPLVLIFLLCITVVKKSTLLFFLAFISGLFLDIFTLHPLGMTSIYSLCFLFLVLLYERKYEITSYPFIIVASFVGSLGYLVLFGYKDVLLQAGISILVALVLFFAFKKRRSREFSMS